MAIVLDALECDCLVDDRDKSGKVAEMLEATVDDWRAEVQ
jgi:hypothetical protein